MFLMKLSHCSGSSRRASEPDGSEMVRRDCCGDKAQDLTTGVGGYCRVKAIARGAEEVKEWKRPGCWAVSLSFLDSVIQQIFLVCFMCQALY